jgi:alpha-mannosidase
MSQASHWVGVSRCSLSRLPRSPAGIVLANGLVAVTIDADGLFSSLRDLGAGRELIPAGERGNLLRLHRDTPTQWDAWDIDQHYKHTATDLIAANAAAAAAAVEPGRAASTWP